MTTDSTDTLTTDWVGRRAAVFGLALRTGFLTVLTLGFYRFWMKTRLRRWYWSAIRPGGLPLEYVGDPVEKLLGFFVAVVILAFYIGIVNLALMFISFSLFQGNGVAYLLSFVGVIPLWFYAQYRSRRYVLARTRWRGLRFGLDSGACGYVGRALMHWAITILSLGLLWPRMTFALERYKTERTSFGTARMEQGGRWQMLYPATKPLFLALLFGAGAGAAFLTKNAGMGGILAVLSALIALYGVVHYRVETLRLLTGTKRLDGVGLTLRANPWRILMIYVLGYLMVLLAVALPALILAPLMLALQAAEMLVEMDLGGALDFLENVPRALILGVSAALYFTIFLLWSALAHTFVTLPVMRHYANGLSVTNPDALSAIRQRPRDEVQQAEGFAEALDVGASI
ncbi:DUF898 domain-containing protein [Puniceibacterium sp. IMCC21224]|uniref:DUF898 domain-containing protein n=1 Tax=Puniceibacterium sp. IMCC21224 TaxID=1618204 RepID=UPI000A8375AC|nr:DUF898 domain-containing protein [Puniceibacterium sp. IMCC21224]